MYRYFMDLDFRWTIHGGWKCCRFVLNRHESYESAEVCGHVLRTRKVHVSLFHGSWLLVGYTGWLKMLLIRVDSIELTRIVSPVVDSSCRKSICMYRYFTDLDFWWAIQGGWKCCQFESIWSNRHESFLLLSIRYADRIDTNRSSCCRFVMPEVDLRDATPCESSWDVTCESNRIV